MAFYLDRVFSVLPCAFLFYVRDFEYLLDETVLLVALTAVGGRVRSMVPTVPFEEGKIVTFITIFEFGSPSSLLD